MEKIKGLLGKLKRKYKTRSLIEFLRKKYNISKENIKENYDINKENIKDSNNNTTDSSNFDIKEIDEVVFTNSKDYNKRKIEQMYQTIEGLEEYCENETICDEDKENEKKLIIKYKNELKKLIESNKIEDGEKLAKSYLKSIKKTLIKLWTIKNYSIKLIDYFQNNGFKFYSYPNQYKLTDDDIELLNEQSIESYKVLTNNPDNNYKVIEMIQPIIYITYITEDNEVEAEVIEGICKFYYIK